MTTRQAPQKWVSASPRGGFSFPFYGPGAAAAHAQPLHRQGQALYAAMPIQGARVSALALLLPGLLVFVPAALVPRSVEDTEIQ
jgi:hypothetical protein